LYCQDDILDSTYIYNRIDGVMVYMLVLSAVGSNQRL